MLTDCKTLLLSLEAGVLTITLNRPHKRNAMDNTMVNELIDVFTRIADDREIRAVVLKGSEGNFCAGGDISTMKTDDNDTQTRGPIWQFNRNFGRMITLVNQAPQVVIALLEGAVLGGGFGLACVSDVAVADANASFAMPETGLGIVPAQIAPFVVMRIGLTQARSLALLGERMNGHRAQALGLVHRVTESEEATQAETSQIVKRVKRCAPRANALTKALMLDVGQYPLDDLLDCASDDFTHALNGPEGQEGTSAFLQKRLPQWAE